MKLVMASYFEPENHGPGRKIGITSGKPRNVVCDFRFDPLDPGQLYWDYQDKKNENAEEAGRVFVAGYKEKLKNFVEDVKKTSLDENKSVFEVLPFQDGDSLLSWEHKGHTSFRAIAAEYLRELGYDVDES